MSIGSHGFRDELTITGRKIRLKGTQSGASLSNGLSVVQLYESAAPNLDRFEENILTDNKAFVLGIGLMVQHRRGPIGMALEIDSAGGKRTLAVLASQAKGLRSDQKNGLFLKIVLETQDRVFRAVKTRIEHAVNVLERADARAIPGDHCAQCHFGELCRLAPDLEANPSPFGSDKQI